jgi:F-type H+-transporting ATPase subunit a
MRDLFHPRVLAILAVVLGAIFVNRTYVPHHQLDNPFMTLFMHLMPERLVHDAHGHGDHGHADQGHDAHGEHAHTDHTHTDHTHASPYLLAVPLPGLPALFDMTPAAERTVADGEGRGHTPQLILTNLQVFQLASVLIILIAFSGVPAYLRTGRGDVVTRLFAGFASWVRDDVVQPVMGKELGTKFLPYFLAVFFFILFINLMGLLPHSATATASIAITGALAALTLLGMIAGGMIVQGPLAFWKNLVPHVPLAMWPLMFVVELAGLIVKPFALMLRLFATISGGHMVVLSFMGLILFFGASYGAAVGYVSAPIWVGFGVFIMIIEAFVAMLQAFIFTQLSVIFINAALHPEH